jgi:hypothetical protein
MKKSLLFALIMLISSAQLLFGQGIQSHSSKSVKASYNAKTGYLYTKMTPSPDLAIASQRFPDFGNCVLQGADDFVVTGTGWSITKIDVIGTSVSVVPANSFEVYIYTNAAGVPGGLVYSGTSLAYTESGGVYSITLASPANLTAGTYWVSVLPNMAFTSLGQWFWQPAAAPQQGNLFAWQDPCSLIEPSMPTFTPMGPFASYTNYDLCFALYGNPITSSIPVSNWALYFGIFLIVVFSAIRFRKMI